MSSSSRPKSSSDSKQEAFFETLSTWLSVPEVEIRKHTEFNLPLHTLAQLSTSPVEQEELQKLIWLGRKLFHYTVSVLIFQDNPSLTSTELRSLVWKATSSVVISAWFDQKDIVLITAKSEVIVDTLKASFLFSLIGAILLGFSAQESSAICKGVYRLYLALSEDIVLLPQVDVQTWCLKNTKSLPTYRLDSESGIKSPIVYRVTLVICGDDKTTGVGNSVEEAKDAAAIEFYTSLSASNSVTSGRRGFHTLSSLTLGQSPKTVLNELIQEASLPLPVYIDISQTGPHHSPTFIVAITLAGKTLATGTGGSKAQASSAAARVVLSRFKAGARTAEELSVD